MKDLGPRCLGNHFWVVIVVTIILASFPQLHAASGSSPISALQISITPSSMNFGSVLVGSTSPQAASITNSSNTTVTIAKISVPQGFTVSGLAVSNSLAPGQSLSFSVIFAPSAAGTVSGSVSITVSGSSKKGGKRTSASATIAVSGTGMAQGQLVPSPTSVSFGSVTTSTTSSQSVQVTNSGGSTTTISQVAISGTGFSVGAVALPVNLSPGQSATFNVKFSPTSPGTTSGSLNISSNASNPSLSVGLNGSGVSPATLSASPLSVNFGSVTTSTTATNTVQITNAGGSSGTISQVTVTGGGFAVTAPSLPLTLAPGQSTSLNVTFRPTATGSATGNLAVSSNASNPSLNVSLAGSGVSPAAFTVSPTSVSFGNVQVGTTRTQNAYVTNTGGSSASISQVTVAGSGFSVSGLNAPFTLSAGQSATFSISFAPTATGTSSGSVTLSSTVSVPPIALSGSGTSAGQLAATPTSLSFGSVVVGASGTQPASLTASGASVTVSAASSTDSEFTLSGITFPITIAAGQTIPFNVIFAPTATGTATGNLTFTSSASTSSAIALSGSGATPPQHTVTLSWAADTSTVSGYNVYRGTASGGPYTQIYSLDPNTTYSDSTVQAGSTYYYVVTAVGTSGTESGYSNQVQAVIPSP